MNSMMGALRNVLEVIKIRSLLTRYFFDGMKFDYQPIPWLGICAADVRGPASIERWNAISPLIGTYDSFKDIGCCVGYFCHNAASDHGMYTFGYDLNKDFIDVANYTSKYVENGEREVFINMNLTPKSVQYINFTDITVLLSVWHHWVFYYGLSEATLMLQDVWCRTGEMLFFESGEEEVADEFSLPFKSAAASWLEQYLQDNLEGAKVSRLGEYSAGNYSHYLVKNHKRTMFLIRRVHS